MKFLRMPAVVEATGVPKSTLYWLTTQGLFPRPVKLGERAAGWPDVEVDAINAARLAGRSAAEIRALVDRLHQQRQAAA